MMKMLATLALLATVPAGTALADNDCRPASQPQSWEAVVQLANDSYWTIRSMKIDDGCYELVVTDPGGNILEALVDPATLDVVDARVRKFADGDAPPVAASMRDPSN